MDHPARSLKNSLSSSAAVIRSKKMTGLPILSGSPVVFGDIAGAAQPAAPANDTLPCLQWGALTARHYGPGVGVTEQPAPFCQFCRMEMETVFAALPVMVRNMAPLASLLMLKLFSCAPLPLSV